MFCCWKTSNLRAAIHFVWAAKGADVKCFTIAAIRGGRESEWQLLSCVFFISFLFVMRVKVCRSKSRELVNNCVEVFRQLPPSLRSRFGTISCTLNLNYTNWWNVVCFQWLKTSSILIKNFQLRQSNETIYFIFLYRTDSLSIIKYHTVIFRVRDVWSIFNLLYSCIFTTFDNKGTEDMKIYYWIVRLMSHKVMSKFCSKW